MKSVACGLCNSHCEVPSSVSAPGRAQSHIGNTVIAISHPWISGAFWRMCPALANIRSQRQFFQRKARHISSNKCLRMRLHKGTCRSRDNEVWCLFVHLCSTKCGFAYLPEFPQKQNRCGGGGGGAGGANFVSGFRVPLSLSKSDKMLHELIGRTVSAVKLSYKQSLCHRKKLLKSTVIVA